MLDNEDTVSIVVSIVSYMADTRLPKQRYYSELLGGSRHKGRPLLRYKDSLKEHLNACGESHENWESTECDCSQWRTTVHHDTKQFEKRKPQILQEKRAACKSGGSSAAPVICPTCGKICASGFGLMAHRWKHNLS